ncbi:MAG: hypothetical protein BGP06_13320 [Rhizobiales bacterium 65-9]|nr:hypothetical protein [Hyphomicrobiales bacterium]OJY36693.1 MAG: hypothetical protein BGP06_13320 [Rhizobiales bacterium 65-9]
MSDPKPGVVDAAQQIFVLAFDLVDSEIGRLPMQIKDALESPPVVNAIKKTLLDFANKKYPTGDSVVTGEEAKAMAAALEKNVGGAFSSEMLNQIKGTPQYRRLTASIDAFQKAAASSSLGVWIDRNKNVLYVVGAALVVGTSTVLYVTRAGGPLVNDALAPLKDKDFDVLQVGKLTLAAGLWDFRPDARILGARISGTIKWERVTLKLKLGLLAQGAEVQQANGEAVVKSGGFNLTFTGQAKPQAQTVNLGLKVGYSIDRFSLSVGAACDDGVVSGVASAQYKTKDVIFGLQGNAGPQKDGGSQWGGMLTITIPVN